MKEVLELFYKNNKEQKERPKITVKLRSTVTPSERLTFDEWCKEYRVSLTYYKKIIHFGLLVDLCVRAPQVKLGSFFYFHI
jgi:hypothetical protein